MKAEEGRQEAEGRGQKEGSEDATLLFTYPVARKLQGQRADTASNPQPPLPLQRWIKRIRGSFWVGLGYMLSPLSWWNDLFFNLPVAYAFGYLVRFFVPQWFLPATVVGYWLSNVLGILMMQFGAADVLFENRERNLRKDVLVGVGTSTLYTLAVVALVYFHVLETPQLFTLNP